jgi:hypothetical protein
VSGPLEMIGDPDAAACEGDFGALPTTPSPEPEEQDEVDADRSAA